MEVSQAPVIQQLGHWSEFTRNCWRGGGGGGVDTKQFINIYMIIQGKKYIIFFVFL